MSTIANHSLQLQTSNRQILSIALPIAASILVPQINFITNNIFLGGLGEVPLAVAGITGVYYLMFAVVGHGLNNGLQALISRRAGEDRVGEIGELFSQGVFIALTFSAMAILFHFVVTPMLLKVALADQQKYEMAVSFLRIRMWGLPFLYLYQMRNALLVGTNNSKYLIIGTLAETVTNIGMDYGLIYGNFGLPKMGFNGAAVASIVAEATGLLVVFAVIYFKGIGRELQLHKHWHMNWKNAKLILVQSSPLILQFGISIASWEYFYILIEHYGTRDLAVSNAMRNVFGLFGCFAWAFAATSNTMVSNIIGQHKKSEVIPLVWKITRLSLMFVIVPCLLVNLFPHAFLSVFGQDESFIQYAIPVLRVVSTALLLMAFGTVWLNAITGTGNTKVNLGIEVLTIVLYVVYVTL
ncbi:MAG TPA: MATE family efflux transporter, partial [Phnomibacter sp.]|nr:MATE family efflux transporter [Phnomibacter sp.]